MRVLFLCTGNTCRSPMAEALMTKLSREKGLDPFFCASAGLYAAEGAKMSDTALAVLKEEYGIADFSHRAVQVTRDLLQNFDLVVAMTCDHARVFGQLFPAFDNVAVMPHDVGDPYGGDYDTYKRSAQSILAGLESLIESGVIHG